MEISVTGVAEMGSFSHYFGDTVMTDQIRFEIESPKKNNVNIEQLLGEDAVLPANAFRIDRSGLIEEGINLTLNAKRADGKTFPPHLRIGEVFLTNGNPGAVYRPIKGQGIVRRLALREGDFPKVVRPEKDDTALYLLVNANFQGAGQLRTEVRRDLFGTAEEIMMSRGEALIRFNADGEKITVFYADGHVLSIERQDGALWASDYSKVEMLNERLEQAERQLEICEWEDDEDKAYRRREGILFGIILLLRLTRSYPEVRDRLIDWLKDRSDLSFKMKERIAEDLKHLADIRALEFVDHGRNVFSIFVNNEGRTGPSAESRARKSRISAESRMIRDSMKGSSSGGGGKNAGSKGKKKHG